MKSTHKQTTSIAILQKQALDFREERNWAKWHHAKTLGLGLFVEAGELAEHFLYHRDHELLKHLQTHISEVSEELADVLYWLIIIAHESGFGLDEAFLHKMNKNLAADKDKNYTAVTMELPNKVESLAQMTTIIQEFRTQRGWGNNLEPRDLIYKLIEEIGEISEYFQWKHEDQLRDYLVAKRLQLSEEVADSLICVLLLALSLDIDLEVVFAEKIAKNREKYPV
jgi:NTP pyrophosphatase (non-canonical NTP hydrolase)